MPRVTGNLSKFFFVYYWRHRSHFSVGGVQFVLKPANKDFSQAAFSYFSPSHFPNSHPPLLQGDCDICIFLKLWYRMRSWKQNWVIIWSKFKHGKFQKEINLKGLCLGFEIDKYVVQWLLLWYLDLCLAKPFLDLHDFPQRSYRMEIPVMWFASMWSLIWFLSTHFTYSYSSLAFVRISIVTEYYHWLQIFKTLKKTLTFERWKWPVSNGDKKSS